MLNNHAESKDHSIEYCWWSKFSQRSDICPTQFGASLARFPLRTVKADLNKYGLSYTTSNVIVTFQKRKYQLLQNWDTVFGRTILITSSKTTIA